MSSLGQKLWQSRGVRWISLGWSGFIVENLVFSHNREEIIRLIGDDNYHRAYNTLSTIACSSILYGYIRHGRRHGPPITRFLGKGGIALGFVLQSLGFVGLSQLAPRFQIPVAFGGSMESCNNNSSSAARTSEDSEKKSITIRCPMDFRPRDVPADGIYGTLRVSRHAAFWSFASACLGQAAATVFLPEVVMFSFPTIFAIIGTTHQDYRFRRGWGGTLTPEQESKTSNIPFVALLQGRQSWSALMDEMKWTNAGMAVTAAALIALRNAKRF